jgi:hypothetical protein
MLRHPLSRGLLLAVLPLIGGALGLPSAGAAQEREILLSQVTVSGAASGLHLELVDGGTLTVDLSDGRLRIDGSDVGPFPAGGSLDASWRELLSRAIATEPEALTGVLLAWTPPADLPGDVGTTGAVLRARLVETLAPTASPAASALPSLGDDATGAGLLSALLRREDRLAQLAALGTSSFPGDARAHVGETLRVEAGEVLPYSLLVLEGEVLVFGTIDGDLALLGGSVELGPQGRITGDLRWADAEIRGDRANVSGTIEEVHAGVPQAGPPAAVPPPPAPSELERLREEIRRELLAETGTGTPAARGSVERRGRSAFAEFGQGLAGLFRTLVTFGILLGAGLGLLYFFPRQLEVVARTARSTMGRSAMVGLAGIVLAVPVWVTGIVLLAVSIIGIPALLVWIPALPLGLIAALAVGYLAVARNLGRWLAGKDFPGFSGVDTTRPAIHLGAGLIALLAAFALSNVFRMGGTWLGVFRGILLAAGITATVAAICVGLGAVILSRAGRDPTFSGPGWGAIGEDEPDLAS